MEELEFDRWLSNQIEILKSNNLDRLDIDNLIEELEALGRAEKSAVKSLVYRIILHLLLIDFCDKESIYTRDNWHAEVDILHIRLEDRLTTDLKEFRKYSGIKKR
jgi:hypothetical protein